MLGIGDFAKYGSVSVRVPRHYDALGLLPAGTAEFEVPHLPAATLAYRGSMDALLDSLQPLGRWIGENGYRSAGIAGERYVSCDGGPADWVTELQEPAVRVS